ncbi:hypothetical protein [Actinocorallia sp. A-T 12471]|uniref:hypothetical protein n=1 Tax=Actinocorallia sp. A-T 12471 TaxID=3089813 RepID=UPI0029D38075|nr:hypothetical protein [Actinocorallia sp. A-T 12471]MDX6739562.1 hypothetical protein [Actinocorallia sp. A-T 12471]
MITEDTQTRTPRNLVSTDLFSKIVARIQEHMPVATTYAETMVEQMLAYMATVAAYDPENPPADLVQDGHEFIYLTPSAAVDPAIHYFLDFTAEYRAFCADLTDGAFLDHVPVTHDDIRTGKSVTLTTTAMAFYGWPVDPSMWEQGTSCCQTDNCYLKVTRLTA